MQDAGNQESFHIGEQEIATILMPVVEYDPQRITMGAMQNSCTDNKFDILCLLTIKNISVTNIDVPTLDSAILLVPYDRFLWTGIPTTGHLWLYELANFAYKI